MQTLGWLSWNLAYSVFIHGATDIYAGVGVSWKNMGQSILSTLKTRLTEVNWNETLCACLTHGPKSSEKCNNI